MGGRVVPAVVGISLLGALGGEPAGTARAGPQPSEDTVVPLSDGFEDEFAKFNSGCVNCAVMWRTVMSPAHSGSHSIHAADAPNAGENILFPIDAVAIPPQATAASLTFWHQYDFEYTNTAAFDGGVLEVSTDGGNTWRDGTDNIILNGYTGTIATGHDNPLEGRAAWVERSGGWSQVGVDLMPYRGQSFKFRLRLGTDESNLSEPEGWSVDDVEISFRAALPTCDASWSMVNPYPIAVQQSTAVAFHGVLFVFGGRMEDNSAVDDAYAYTPNNDTWTPIASLPEPRYGATAVTDGHSIYILGGAVDNREANSIWRYDPANNNYVTLPPFATATRIPAAALLDGVIYRIGGEIDFSNGAATATVEAFTIGINSWEPIADLPSPLYGLAAEVIDGYIFTAGGAAGFRATNKTYRYDPATKQWDDGPIADLPAAANELGTLYNDSWVVNGIGTGALAWTPRGNYWRSLDQIPRLASAAGVAATNDALYVIGGAAALTAEPLRDVQRYVEADCAVPTPTRVPTGSCLGDCGGDGSVAVAELIRGVNVALGLQPFGECPAFDGNGDGMVGVNELVAAVNNALNGCA